MNGYFKFHRAMLEHPVWNLSPGQFKVWVACLALANFKPAEWWDGRERVEILPGSFITSQPHLADAAGVSRKIARGAIQTLIQLGSIWAKPRAKRWTLIEIVNWPTYQGQEEEEGQAEGRPRAKQGPSEGHNVRRKEEIPYASDPALAGGGTLKSESRGKKTAKPTDPNVRVVLDAYHEAFRAKHGTPPPLNGGKCGAIAKQLLRGRPVTEAVWLVREFFAAPPQFYADKNLCGLDHVLSAAPSLIARRTAERGHA